MNSGTSSGGLKGATKTSEAIRYNVQLPNLFKFAYYTLTEDVPDDILEPVIFALSMFIREIEEESDEQLRAIGHLLPHQKDKATIFAVKYILLANARMKICNHLMNPKVNRPEETIPHLKKAIEHDAQRMKTKNERGKGWEVNPPLWARYGDALFLTGEYKEAKTVFERVLQGTNVQVDNPAVAEPIVKAHMNLAFILQELGVEPDKQKEHTDWATNFIRKHLTALTKDVLELFLLPSSGRSHPVFKALGGRTWLDKLETRKRVPLKEDERRSKICRQCGIRDMQKDLFRCSKCQHIYYCSKECQKANWKLHKEMCNDMYKSRMRTEKLKAEDPSGLKAKRHEDWIAWRNAPKSEFMFAEAHALGLHRDPSRSRTHIMVHFCEYTPSVSNDLRYKFRCAHSGVFKVSEIAPAIEAIMGLDPGEAPSFVDEAWMEANLSSGTAELAPGTFLPIMELLMGDGLETWLGTGGMAATMLRTRPYNPEWRKVLNKGDSPEPVRFRPPFDKFKDAEYVFD
ncbi:unnamed protein product [Peniophora sp. CBMAI 1063]|nr:unnamed protein product [Peniophora sp. CBMAI 1063]